jgi:RNA polymerase sigma factor (sigma-70 family)
VAKSTAAVLGQAIRSVEALAEPPAVSDQDLLRRFAEHNDQAAFALLVRRHGSMVLGVCRRALGNVQDAEDACQATFLVLARKAAAGQWRPSIASWLYTTARHIATNARLLAQRRSRRESRAAVRKAVDPVDQVTGRELLAALDEELARLPPRYREPLVLCYLEELTRDEAAARLGVPAGTVKMQLERGRKKLAEALTRRGCNLGTGLFVLAVTSPARVSSPRLVQGALATVSGSPPAAVAALTGGVSMSTFASRLMVALFVLIGATALGVGLWLARPTAVEGPTARQAEDTRPKPAAVEEAHVLSGRVLGPDGRPIRGARLWAVPRFGRKDGFEPIAAPEPTGRDGRFRFTVAKARTQKRRDGFEIDVAVVGTAPGYLPGWAEGREDTTVRLAREDARVTGRVTNLEGRPLPGVTVRVTTVLAPVAGALDPWLAALRGRRKGPVAPREGMYFGSGVAADVLPGVTVTARTNADGRFELAGFGKDRLVHAVVEGPGIVMRNVGFFTRDMGAGVVGTSAAGIPYHGTTGSLAVAPSRLITGVVRDRLTGQPLAGVTVSSYLLAGSNFINTQVQTTSDARGRFTLAGMPKGDGNVILAVPGPAQPHLGASARVPDPAGFAPVTVDFALRRGVWIEGVVTDQASKPVPRVWVAYYADESNERAAREEPGFAGHLARKLAPTGADGRFRAVGLPGAGFLVATAPGNRYLAACDRAGKGGVAQAILPTLPYRAHTDSCHAVSAIDVPRAAQRFRRDLSLEDGQAVLVTLVGPNGQEVTGAESFARLAASSWQKETRPGQHRIEAINPKQLRTVLFRHRALGLAGMLRVPADFTAASCRVPLRPGVTLTGRALDDEGNPKAGARVSLRFLRTRQDDAAESWAALTGQKEMVTTGADGRFQIVALPPGLAYELVVSGRYLAQFRLAPDATGVKDLGDLQLPMLEN